MIKKIVRRFLGVLSSLRFRIRHSVYRGSVRVDNFAIENSRFGRGLALRGMIACHMSHIEFGDCCTISRSAEIGAESRGQIQVGSHVSFGPRTIVSTSGGRVIIGNNNSFFSDCIVSGMVSIGNDCLFANNVTVLSGKHQIYGDGTIRENDAKFQEDANNKQLEPVTIGDDCWLGANVVILPGINLAKGTVVGANAVVTKDFPEYSILGGVPASIIGSRLNKK